MAGSNPSGQGLKLGDEAEDVVSGVRGILSQHIQHLDGSSQWVLQPKSQDATEMPRSLYVEDAYLKRIGDGVRAAKQKNIMGFHARSVEGDK